jgi:hypothetical protein
MMTCISAACKALLLRTQKMKIFTLFIIKLGQNLKLFIMQLYDKFESVAAAYNVIKAYVLD